MVTPPTTQADSPAPNLPDAMAISPLARFHCEQEGLWRDFLERNYPGARLLRWGPQHRVYRCGDRVAKVEWETISAKDSTRGIEYEFSLLEALEGRASCLHPTYRVIDGTWCVLEMDWVEGDYLDDLIAAGRAREVSLIRLAAKLFRVSLAGVDYKQLRARHVIRRPDGDLVFIDFGHSTHAGPLVALWRNLAPLTFSGGSWHVSRLVSMIRAIMRRRVSSQGQGGDASPDPLRRWRINDLRRPAARAEHLAVHPGDPVAARHFAAMEQCLSEAVEADPRIGEDLIKFQFADYGMAGSRDWGFIWDYLSRRLDFAGKRIVDLACGMGGVGAYARLDGAAHVAAFDSPPLLLDAARNFSQALGFTDNSYQPLDWAKLAAGDAGLPDADVITALSVRLDDVPRERLLDCLTRYPEILWQTSDAEAGRRELAARGYGTVETLVRSDIGRYILYATGRGK